MLVPSSSTMNEFSKRASTVPDPTLISENRTCPGCHLSVVDETGGVVVAFGQSFFHVDCFKCAKCGDHVTADTNLLLLSDGSPICANCSYSCNICKLPILDEAIMTGDDSYHAHCFKCKVCSNRIDELVFAKTSQGIYCMSCHNQRVARSRRHQQRRKEQAAVACANGGRSREHQPVDFSELGRQKQNGTVSSSREQIAQLRSTPDSSSITNIPHQNGHYSTPKYQARSSQPGSPPVPPDRSQPVELPQTSHYQPPSNRPTGSRPMSSPPRHKTQHSLDASQPLVDGFSVPPLSVSASLQRTEDRPSSDSAPPTSTFPRAPSESLPVPEYPSRRKSHDDGVRPLNVLMDQNPNSTSFYAPTGTGLQAPSSRAEKRRSINPALSFDSSIYCEPSQRSSVISTSSNTKRYPEAPLGGGESRQPLSSHCSDSSTTPSPTPSGSHEKLSLSSPFSSSSSPGSLNLKLDITSQQTRTPSSSTEHSGPGRSNSLRTPSSPANGIHERLSPLGQVAGSSANSIRSMRSFDGGPQLSPTYSIDGRLSPSASSEQHANWTISSSGSPASPSHRIDVPTEIDSEGELDRHGHDQTILDGQEQDRSLSPKKEPRGGRPPRLNLEPSRSHGDVPDGLNVVTVADTEDPSGSEISRESSPVEQTSHTTFIAPALPPIRFSMNAADFSDFLKFSDGQAPKALARIGGKDGASSNSGSNGSQYLTLVDKDQLVSTPTSAITIMADIEEKTSVTYTASQSHSPASSESLIPTPEREEKYSTPPRGLDITQGDTPRPPPVQVTYSENTSIYSTQERSSSDSQRRLHHPATLRRERMDSNASVHHLSTGQHLPSTGMHAGSVRRMDTSDLVAERLRDLLDNAADRSVPHLNLDKGFVEAIIVMVEQRKEEYLEIKGKLDGLKRASQQYMDGMTVAQTEYEREVRAKRDAESEVTRLRVLLSGQAAKLAALSGETKRQQAQVELSKEMNDTMSGLERDLSNLRVERDMTLAEVEELSVSKGVITETNSDSSGAKLSRNMTVRLDKIKKQYKHDLLPLTQQWERLGREIEDLKVQRDLLLEETTVLNIRNEELAQLTTQYVRRAESAEGLIPTSPQVPVKQEYSVREKTSQSFDKHRLHQTSQSLTSQSSITLSDDIHDVKANRITKPDGLDLPGATFRPPKFLKWSGKASKEHLNNREPAINVVPPETSQHKGRTVKEHIFQPLSALRIGRCDHCGDKMWGSHLRCSSCSIVIHPRCLHHVQPACIQHFATSRDYSVSQMTPLPPSMFGRELSEQVQSDSRGGNRTVPVIVEKCINAVDTVALDYEGIYRKTGGSGQVKIITQLFESGEYTAFDLCDTDRFNDICSVTSVLKTYLRCLPNPLYTHALHDDFIAASVIRDPATKSSVLSELVAKLPRNHYYTARLLMLHLHRVMQQSDVNLMTARNLGVVFGPTLMRSQDAGAEFSDMAGKALTVEWLVEHAPTVFNQPHVPN